MALMSSVASSSATAIATVIAVLPLPSTTLTATSLPGTTGLAVLDGTTLSYRAQGITLSNGEVVSAGLNGLVQSTTTAFYESVIGSETLSATISGTNTDIVIISGTNTASTTNLLSASVSLPGPVQTASLGNGTSTTLSSRPTPVPQGGSSTVLSSGEVTSTTATGSSSAARVSTSSAAASASATGSATAASSTSSAAAVAGPTLSAGKAAMVLGAAGMAVVAYAL